MPLPSAVTTLPVIAPRVPPQLPVAKDTSSATAKALVISLEPIVVIGPVRKKCDQPFLVVGSQSNIKCDSIHLHVP